MTSLHVSLCQQNLFLAVPVSLHRMLRLARDRSAAYLRHHTVNPHHCTISPRDISPSIPHKRRTHFLFQFLRISRELHRAPAHTPWVKSLDWNKAAANCRHISQTYVHPLGDPRSHFGRPWAHRFSSANSARRLSVAERSECSCNNTWLNAVRDACQALRVPSLNTSPAYPH